MLHTLIIFFYIPTGIFISFVWCFIVSVLIWYSKRNSELVTICIMCVVYLLISVLYIYPVRKYIDNEQYLLYPLVLVIGLYVYLGAIITLQFNDYKSLFEVILVLCGKSLIICNTLIIYYQNIQLSQQIMIGSADLFLSLTILPIFPYTTYQLKPPFPLRSFFMFVMQLTMLLCIVLLYSSYDTQIHIYLFIIVSLMASIGIVGFLFTLCIGEYKDWIGICDSYQYTSSEKHIQVVKLIKEHVNKNYNSSIDKYTLALQCEMHPDYITKVFKSEEGITINTYIRIVRLEKAYDLLLNTDKKIIEVAFDVGYENLATFYRHFSEHFKKSPKQIRNIR